MPAGLHTRRELLKKGTLALGSLPLLGSGSLFPPARSAGGVPLRCVTLGVHGVIDPGSSQDYRVSREFVLESRTPWVRLWADWPSLQPEPGVTPDAGSRALRVLALDAQVAQANADGVNVILTSYRFPQWANGTAGLPLTDATFQLQDRTPKLGYPGMPKEIGFRLPPDFGPRSQWAGWIEFLVSRYSANSFSRKATIAALEVVNEPNLQLWPLQAPSVTPDPWVPGPITIHGPVAQMFATAQSIVAAYGGEPLLMGPSTSDAAGHGRVTVGYDTFMKLLLDELDRIGFDPGPRFAWSHHNYSDVEYDQGPGSLTGRTATHAVAARELLTGRWAGWPSGDPSIPGLLIPEGGARLSKIGQVFGTANVAETRALQAELIARSAARMRDVGIEMIGQYLFYTDPRFDSGLCDADGAKRPAFATWGALPG